MRRAELAVLAAVILLPVAVRHSIATEIWIFAIFGLGLNLLMGYTGLLSFGVGSSRVDLQACKLEYSIVSPK